MSDDKYAFDANGEPRSAEEIAQLKALDQEREFNEAAAAERAERDAEFARQREQRRRDGARGDAPKVSYLPDIHRLLPQAPDAERGILSSALLAPVEIMALCQEKGVSEEWFHIPANALTWKSLTEIHAAGKPIDFISLTQWLRDRDLLESVGGAAFITELFTFLPTAANAGYYLEIGFEKRILREIIKASTELAARAYDEQDELPELFAQAERLLIAITEAQDRHGGMAKAPVSIRETVLRTLGKLSGGKTEESWGLSTGYATLDSVARGLRAGNMIGIAGDTGTGKTSLALNIVHNICVKRKGRALVFSLEMTAEEVTEVLLQIGSGVNNDAVLEGRSNDNENAAVNAAAAALAEAPLTIRDDTDISITQIRSIARRLKPRLIVLDYAQLIRGGKKKYDRADMEIAEVSGQAKKMAGEVGATVVIISQLNDEGKAAGSRSLTKDCNQWWIVEETAEDERTVKVCKQRRGKKDKVEFRFIGPAQKFLSKGLT